MSAKPSYATLAKRVEELERILVEQGEQGRRSAIPQADDLGQLDAGGDHLYRTLVESTNSFVFALDEAGCFAFVNRYWTQRVGYSAEEIIGTNGFDLIDPSDIPSVSKAFGRAFEGRFVENIEFRSNTRHGDPIDVLVNLTPIVDGAGKLTRLLGTGVDITQRKQIEAELQSAHDRLEKTIVTRTAELRETNRKLTAEVAKHQQTETYLRDSEARLRASENEYRMLVDSSLVGIFKTRLNGAILYVNHALTQMFGYDSSAELIAAGALIRYRAPEERARFIEAMQRSGRVDNYELVLVDKIGREKTVLVCASLDSQNVSGVIIDISDRKRFENALHDSEQRYRLLVEHNPDAVFCHREGIIILANPAAVDLFGATSPEDLIGRDFFSLVHPDDIKTIEARREQLVDGGHLIPLFQARFLRIDGGQVTVEVNGALVTLGDGPAVQTVARDITARVAAERALADSQRRLADIIDFLPDPTWVIDTHGRVIAWNLAMERMTGIAKADILGRGDHAYAVPFYGEPRPVLIDLVLRRDPRWEKVYPKFEVVDTHLFKSETFHPQMGPDGRHLAGTAAPLYNAAGDVVGAIQSVRDITAAKQAALEREHLIDKLQAALADVRTLSGLLPICANCKKIRDDSGYWNQIDTYIRQHTDADVSHGLCPDCMETMYGGQAWYEKIKKKGES
ncbi:MAG: PAS domain S-box protein [Desulfosarcinaceae bacterium]|nr:PAS domain S-box protein [Desulfosarcinaceae bacterium]